MLFRLVEFLVIGFGLVGLYRYVRGFFQKEQAVVQKVESVVETVKEKL